MMEGCMKDFIAFFGEFIVVIAVAGVFYAMSPEGTQKRYVNFAISLCVLAALIGPMISVVSALPEILEEAELDLEENRIDIEGNIEGQMISASRENIEATIISMISQRFDISAEKLTVAVTLNTEDPSNIEILSVTVRVADATYVRRAEIKKYLSDMLMDVCEVEVSEWE
jgi:hypothetical protein